MAWVLPDLGAAEMLLVSERVALLASAPHPNLATCVGLDTIGGQAALIVAEARGTPLSALEAEHLNATLVPQLLTQAVTAVGALHQLGLSHGNLTAESFVLLEDGRLRLVDLALALDPAAHPVPREDIRALASLGYDLFARAGLLGGPADAAQLPASTWGVLLQRMGASDPALRPSCAGILEALRPQSAGSPQRRLPLTRPSVRAFGRQPQRERLLAALDHALQGRSVLVDLVGPGGMGKTRLMDELAELARARGALVGRVQVTEGHLPGGEEPLEHALIEAAGAWLTPDRADHAARTRQLRSQVGEAWETIEALVGARDPAPEGEAARLPREGPFTREQRRWALDELAQALVVLSPGLLLLLDDAQRLDEASVVWLSELLVQVERPLAVVLARRPHPEPEGLAALCVSPDLTEAMVLEGLELDAVEALLRENLAPPPPELEELARLVFARTGGHPVAVQAQLAQLEVDGHLRFDPERERWTVDLAEVATLPSSSGAAGLVAARLHRLEEADREVLFAAACVGARFATDELAHLLDRPAASLQPALATLARAGTVAPEDHASEGAWHFEHDLVRTAALDLDSAAARRRNHGRLARLLLSDLRGRASLDRAARALEHLRQGPPGTLDGIDGGELIELRLGSARRALDEGRFDLAATFCAPVLRPEPDPDPDPALDAPEATAALATLGARAALGLGDVEGARRCLARVEALGCDPLVRAEVAATLVDLHTSRFESLEALAVARSALAALGYTLPPTVSTPAVLASVLRGRWVARGATVESAAALPEVGDPTRAAILRLLLLCTTPAYLADGKLWAWLSGELVRLGWPAGASPGTAWGLANLGIVLAGAFGSLERGEALSAVGRDMMQRRAYPGFRSRDCSAWFVTQHAIRSTLGASLVPLLEGVEAGRKEGDTLHSAICGVFYVQHLLLSGAPLSRVEAAAGRIRRHSARVGVVLGVELITALQRFLAAASRGEQLSPELAAEVAVEAEATPFAQVQAGVLLGLLALLREDGDSATRALSSVRGHLDEAAGTFIAVALPYLEGVAAGRAALGGASLAPGWRRARRLLARRADLNPEELGWRLAHLDALQAAATGQHAAAGAAFSRALDGARAVGNLAEECLIRQSQRAWLERLGAHNLAREAEAAASRAARAWGLVQPGTDGADRSDPRMETVLAVRQSLRRQGSARELASSCMDLVRARYRADRVVLVDLRDGSLRRVAQAGATPPASPAEAPPTLCEAALREAWRSRDDLLLDDVCSNERYRSDPYVRRARPRSLACLPLVQGSEVVGMVYVEHDGQGESTVRDGFEVARLVGHVALAALQQEQLRRTLEAQAAELHQANAQLQRQGNALEDAVRSRTRALERLRRVQSSILDTLGQGVLLADSDGRITYANEAACELLEARPGELLGRELEGAFGAPMEIPLDRGEDTLAPGDFEVRRAAGAQVIEGSRRPQAGGVGEVLSFEDLTWRRELEQQLLQAQKMEAIGQLVAGVAHEFNNLLTPIMGNLDLVAMGLTDPVSLERIDRIQQASGRAAELVQRLLAFGRRTPSEADTVDVAAEVREAVRLIERSIDRAITVSFEAHEPDTLRARVDATQLHQVVLNLVLNARDALELHPAAEGSAIRVRVWREFVSGPAGEPDQVVLEVADNGPGMPPELQTRAFEPFFSTKPVGKGSGLGLSVVFGIAEQHHGSAVISSRPGGGTEVQVRLPASDEAVAPSRREPLAPTAEPGRAAGRQLVLVVDDEPLLRELAREVLERAGFRVELAADGREGLERARALRPDLALVDLSMPELDGWALLAALRETDPDVPVVIWSGYHAHDGEALARSRGARAYLSKPVSPRELVARLSAVLAGADEA